MPAKGDAEMRIVVVGAGVLGASTAYHLAREGADVAVVDQAHEGRATAAGAGILCPWASHVDDPAFYELYAAGARYYSDLVPALSELGETDLGFRRVGALIVSTDPTELKSAESLLRDRRMEAPEIGDVDRLFPREVKALFPPLRADLAGIHVAGGARVDGRRLAASLLRAAEHHGATVARGFVELISRGDRVPSVRLDDREIVADAVVITAGAWSPALLRPLGINLPIQPQRGQIIHLHLPGQETNSWPVVLPPGSHYLLAFDDSRVVAGATRESGAGFDYRVTAAGQAEVLSEALRIAPGLGAATLVETRVGFRPVSLDGWPLLGQVRNVEGLVIGNGLGAAGLTIGPLAGRLLADVVLDRQPALDLAPFDPLRRHEPERMPQPPLR
jgi:glycine/D-amino acid oxidase-like deaminating enzyme